MPPKKKPEIMNVRMGHGVGDDIQTPEGGRYSFRLLASGCLEKYDGDHLVATYAPHMWKMINYVRAAPTPAAIPEPEAPVVEPGEEEQPPA
jgi:hypothetical protein